MCQQPCLSREVLFRVLIPGRSEFRIDLEFLYSDVKSDIKTRQARCIVASNRSVADTSCFIFGVCMITNNGFSHWTQSDLVPSGQSLLCTLHAESAMWLDCVIRAGIAFDVGPNAESQTPSPRGLFFFLLY